MHRNWSHRKKFLKQEKEEGFVGKNRASVEMGYNNECVEN
jgi:hypothetical protein